MATKATIQDKAGPDPWPWRIAGWGLTAVLCAGVLFCYQLFVWLRTGIWQEFPISQFIRPSMPANELVRWIYAPESWIGLSQIVRWICDQPFAYVLGATGIVLFAAVAKFL
jgi:hypothetical protein